MLHIRVAYEIEFWTETFYPAVLWTTTHVSHKSFKVSISAELGPGEQETLWLTSINWPPELSDYRSHPSALVLPSNHDWSQISAFFWEKRLFSFFSFFSVFLRSSLCAITDQWSPQAVASLVSADGNGSWLQRVHLLCCLWVTLVISAVQSQLCGEHGVGRKFPRLTTPLWRLQIFQALLNLTV